MHNDKVTPKLNLKEVFQERNCYFLFCKITISSLNSNSQRKQIKVTGIIKNLWLIPFLLILLRYRHRFINNLKKRSIKMFEKKTLHKRESWDFCKHFKLPASLTALPHFPYSLISLKSIRLECFMLARNSWSLCLPHRQLSAGATGARLSHSCSPFHNWSGSPRPPLTCLPLQQRRRAPLSLLTEFTATLSLSTASPCASLPLPTGTVHSSQPRVTFRHLDNPPTSVRTTAVRGTKVLFRKELFIIKTQ